MEKIKLTHQNIISYYNRSLAFMEHAKLSAAAKDAEFYNIEEYTNVTAYLLYHSIELFLKFSILARTDEKDLATANKYSHHKLIDLKKEYEKAFPEKEYELNLPFTAEVYEQFNSLDQMLKYPCDKKQNLWTSSLHLKFTEDYLIKVENRLKEIASLILIELNII